MMFTVLFSVWFLYQICIRKILWNCFLCKDYRYTYS